ALPARKWMRSLHELQRFVDKILGGFRFTYAFLPKEGIKLIQLQEMCGRIAVVGSELKFNRPAIIGVRNFVPKDQLSLDKSKDEDNRKYPLTEKMNFVENQRQRDQKQKMRN